MRKIPTFLAPDRRRRCPTRPKAARPATNDPARSIVNFPQRAVLYRLFQSRNKPGTPLGVGRASPHLKSHEMSSAHSSSDRLGLGFCDPGSDATLCLASQDLSRRRTCGHRRSTSRCERPPSYETAKANGDDTLQRRSGARVSFESSTHGSSAQRVEWLRRGYQSATPPPATPSAKAEPLRGFNPTSQMSLMNETPTASPPPRPL
jgi:hypothetical protein